MRDAPKPPTMRTRKRMTVQRGTAGLVWSVSWGLSLLTLPTRELKAALRLRRSM